MPLFHDFHVAVRVLVAIELILVGREVVWLILTSVESIVALSVVMVYLVGSALRLYESLVARWLIEI